MSLIKLKQSEGQGGTGAVGYRPVDFAAAAVAMGLPGSVATDATGFDAALRCANAPGPYLIDARIDASEYPRIVQVVRG